MARDFLGKELAVRNAAKKMLPRMMYLAKINVKYIQC